MAKRVFLHIGAPKSGTTFLQTVLWNNRAQLDSADVLLPGKNLFDYNLAITAIRNPRPRNNLQRKAKATWRRLREEIDDWSGDAIITNEWFVRATDEQAAQAREELGGVELHIVHTARAFVHQIPAAWQETLKVGRGWSLADFIAGLDDDEAQWSWWTLDPALAVARWAGDLPPSHVHVVTVPPKGSDPALLWKRMAGVIGVQPDGYDVTAAQQNESLGAEAARLLERMGPVLRTAIDADEGHWTEQYRWIRRYLGHEVLVPLGGSRIGVNSEQAAALHERSVTSTAALEQAGYDVVGNLDDLRLSEPPPGSRDPSEVTDAEMLDVAGPVVAELLTRIRDTTLHAEAITEAAPAVAEVPAGSEVPAQAEASSPTEAPAVTDHGTPERKRRRGRGGLMTRQIDDTRGAPAAEAGPARPDSERVYFLLFSADGADGITRTVFSLANKLVETYSIEIISLYRRRKRLFYPLDRRIVVTNLEDARPIGPKGKPIGGRVRARDVPKERGRMRALLDRRRSRLAPEPAAPDMSLLTDLLLRRKLRSLDPGVLVSTRPALHAAAATYAPRDVITVGQDHLNFQSRAEMPGVMRLVQDSVRRMDSFVVLTKGDLRDYGEALSDADTVVEAIPNAVPWTVGDAAPLDSKIAIAAGRFVARKGFPRLIETFEPVARAHPDWELHIYGKGEDGEVIEREIHERGLEDQVILQGHTDEFAAKLAGASMFVSGSHAEGFPMVIVEAMSHGLPVISFDIPRGPADIIADGENGRLIPDDDLAGFSAAWQQLIEDDQLRREMGAGAHATAQQYEIDAIAGRWEALFTQLRERRRMLR
ncbi:MAG: glycosyltransferase [Nocardioidaceae bacterium]